jgi:hypothetical protein
MLTQLLQELYWRSLEREVRGLVPALAELMLCAPDPTAVEKIPPRPNVERQNQFAKAWGKDSSIYPSGLLDAMTAQRAEI